MNAHRQRRAAARQRGQALTEFIVMALVLVPLFLLMPMLAKYQDIAHATEMASRYVAFEAITRNDSMSSWKPPAQLAGEVRRRFFSNPDAPIKTDDTAGNFMANQNLFWRDPKGDALIVDFDQDVKVSFGAGHSADHSGAFSAASDGAPFNKLGTATTMGLATPGIYGANVTVAVANVPADLDGYTHTYDSFKALNLSMSRHTDLLVDGWAAKNPEQVEARVNHSGVFPGERFTSGKPEDVAFKLAADAISVAATLMESPKYLPNGVCPQPCGPKLGGLEYWRDVVPADRLR